MILGMSVTHTLIKGWAERRHFKLALRRCAARKYEKQAYLLAFFIGIFCAAFQWHPNPERRAEFRK